MKCDLILSLFGITSIYRCSEAFKNTLGDPQVKCVKEDYTLFVFFLRNVHSFACNKLIYLNKYVVLF